MWARAVRDAAAETLPFSQIGGFVLGVRALRLSGPAALRGILSMSVDLVVELAAKLPYALAGVLALLALAPGSGLMRPLGIGLALTVLAVAVPVLWRRQLGDAFQRAIRKVSQRWPVLASLRRMHAHGDINTVLDDILSRRARLGAAFALHMLCWFLGAAELWLVFDLLGRPVTAAHALVVDSIVAGLRTFVFMVPAAAGVQEASYVLACAVFGIAPATAVAASLARRARDLTLGAAVLGVAVGIGPRHHSRPERDLRRVVISPPQHPVTGQAVPGLAEGGGPVVLEEEMPDPGESVADDGRRHEHERPPGDDRRQHDGNHQPAADEMQQAAGRIPGCSPRGNTRKSAETNGCG